ncbi:hypothetical protein D5018_20805 [Parashewanella curva]|uniref:Ribonuclease H1 N-terminal domain-containing protein n=1 Tax=Parashewanella curva TaxID=2338552 RepID=A0A3L8PQU8_9GAMM|nr:RNase H1/viroplasmin domain-containing protein [Parashewanella curva]RLV57767.1 hypothetical protein D5018_20805 [Parashewanella curva]
MPRFYVVFIGRKTGVFFDEWDNVRKLVDGFRCAKYQLFSSKDEACVAFDSFQSS